MMGRQKRVQGKLFYTKLNLDLRVPKDHILRKVAKHIDFDFIYKEVKDDYGINGNVSVPPPVLLKMMLLLIFYNVRSERELMEQSFARSTRYGFKRSRWRRLWRLQIQEYLTAAIQNIMVLVKSFKEQKPSGAKGTSRGDYVKPFWAPDFNASTIRPYSGNLY